MKTLTTLTAAAALFAAPALAQTLSPTYDIDSDNIMTSGEFDTLFVEYASPLTLYDRDGNDLLDASEFAGEINGDLPRLMDASMFDDIDTDGDASISIPEYHAALFSMYDVNADGTLDAGEAAAMEADFDSVGVEIDFIESLILPDYAALQSALEAYLGNA